VIVAVVVLTLLCLGNLLLTVGVIRRLNEHTAALDDLAGEPPGVMRPAGETVDGFATIARDGTPVTLESLGGPTLVGFFSPGCGPCHERLPQFVARARRTPAGRALGVVVGAGAEAQDMAAELADVATVVVEDSRGVLSTAFGVKGFPAFALVDADGRIEACSVDPASIPLLVAA
jgi:thiol-disulfide isomerase/thioredoxin